MPDVDLRPLMLIIWGAGTVGTYGHVFMRRVRTHRIHRDVRSRRDALSSLGLLMTAGAASLSIAFGLFNVDGANLRDALAALALGAFFAVGVILASEDPQVEPGAPMTPPESRTRA